MATDAPKDDHSRVVQWFEAAEDITADSRALSERDADYYDGKQLTDDEIKALKKRGQPPIVNNRVKPKVDFNLGQELKTRTDPKAFPRNPSVDEESANAATDALRFVADTTKFERIRSLCWEDGQKYGTYGTQIVVTPKGDDYKIETVHVPWDRIFYDPHSRAKDFSDAKYKGVVIWQDREDALAMFPGKDAELAKTISESATIGQTFEDKPVNRWADAKRDRVRVVYMEYRQDNKWMYCYFTKGGFLRGPKESPFVDDDGDTLSSLEFQSLFVDRDGNRYGQIRQYICMQDEINKRRSKGLHLLNSRQTIGEKGAVDDVNKAKRELAKPDGHVEFTPGMHFEVLPTNDMAAGNWQMLQEAKAEIDAQGPNAAMVGAEKRDLSGKALDRLQSGGNVETAVQTDGLRDWEHRVYRLMWHCIRKYWTAEKWVRVTDDENTPKYVGLNTMSTAGEQFIKKAQSEGQKMEPEQMQAIMMSPEGQQPVKVNDVTKLDVDIILEDVPDTVTIQQEQFEALTNLFPSMPEPLKPMAFEALLQASSLRNKKQFIEKLQGKGEQPDPNQEMQMQFQQMMMQLDARLKQTDIALKEAQIKKTETAAVLDIANAEKAEAGQQLAEYEAAAATVQQIMSAQEPQPAQTA